MKKQTNNPCPVCGRYENRVMTVDAVVFDQECVLLIKRTNDPCQGLWALPGGYMDFNETAQIASHRELQEETGITAMTSKFIGLFDHPARHPQQVVSAAFLITEWQGTVQAGDDAGEAAWFSTGSLPTPLAFDHEAVIKTALKMR